MRERDGGTRMRACTARDGAGGLAGHAGRR